MTSQRRDGERYKWVALSNTTLAVFMSALDGSIVIIALPAIFRGIHLDPLAPGNVVYLLWMIMGYRLVQLSGVVPRAPTLGLGDQATGTGSVAVSRGAETPPARPLSRS
jgi:hypothetical protein